MDVALRPCVAWGDCMDAGGMVVMLGVRSYECARHYKRLIIKDYIKTTLISKSLKK